jgi:hypothetical protein
VDLNLSYKALPALVIADASASDPIPVRLSPSGAAEHHLFALSSAHTSADQAAK